MNNQIKFLQVTMPDGSGWEIPAEIIANNRATHYEKREPGSYDSEFELTLHDEETLMDWASYNMSWLDVKEHATKFCEADFPNFEYGWLYGEMDCGYGSEIDEKSSKIWLLLSDSPKNKINN
jgi:hypothetical protein